MKKRIMGLLVGAVGIAGGTALALSGVSCSQPSISCVVGHGAFYARYELVSSTGMGCEGVLGDEIGMSTFLAPNADKSLADYNARSIAIQSSTLGTVLQDSEALGVPDTANKAYAFGMYSSTPDDKNICYAGGANGMAALSVAEQNIPEVMTEDDEGNPVTIPAQHLRQTWRNIKVYVTAGAPGTQAVGEMVYEDVIAGCSATYRFNALYPSVYCGMEVDADGDPETTDDITEVASDDLCNPKADPSKGRVFGSGINPDFKVRCDPEVLHCVLAEPSKAAQ